MERRGERLTGSADLHIHTRYSDGRPTVQEALAYAARRTALDVIAITDHDTIEGALAARELAPAYGIAVVVGEEITSREGHILGLFLRARVPPGLGATETVAAIHAQGGLAVAAHPFMRGHSALPGIGPARMGVGAALRRVPFDGVEVLHSFPTLAWANLRACRYNARYGRRAALGNSDAHVVEAIGKGYTRFPGRTTEDLAAAIRAGCTTPGLRLYGPRTAGAYARFIWEATVRRRGDTG